MQLGIKPYNGNRYPVMGLLIRGSAVAVWLNELHVMGVSLSDATVYAIPGNRANTLWGCLVVPQGPAAAIEAGRNGYCQLLNNQLFIPENAVLFPALQPEEMAKLLGKGQYFLHAETGMVALEQPVDWAALLLTPEKAAVKVTVPAKSIYIPGVIKTMQVCATPPDDTLKKMEEESFPERKPISHEPLSRWEQIKLALLRPFFKPPRKTGSREEASGKSNWWQRLKDKLREVKSPQWMNRLQDNYEALEERNKKQVDKLLDMFEKNPEEALKYAVPLDGNGSSRGGFQPAAMNLTMRWNSWSLFDGAAQFFGGGSIAMADDYVDRLRQQYGATAEELIRKGNYEQAAFVYLKLLGDYQLAAATLESGGLYAEAAAVYLKYCNNKEQAAQCYEKGNMLQQAIELYAEMGRHEKAGDLYMNLHKRDDAFYHYGKVVDEYTERRQYVKASKIYRDKMEDTASAQLLLMKGWEENCDALNCLNGYFSGITDEHQLEQEIKKVYTTSLTMRNQENFLVVMRSQFTNHPAIADAIKNIAYEIIAADMDEKPSLAAELRFFNKEDKNLVKDILLYKQSKK